MDGTRLWLKFLTAECWLALRPGADSRLVRGTIFVVAGLWVLLSFSFAQAHLSGCHRWHSCPSDTGSYVCGDRGYDTYCPKPRGPGLRQVQPPRMPAARPVSPAPPAALPAPAPDQRRKTRTAQLLLAELGYDPGKPDGMLGPKTRAAIIRFQTQVGVRPDGQLSDALLIQLSKANNKGR
jgi:hypothetical protein